VFWEFLSAHLSIYLLPGIQLTVNKSSNSYNHYLLTLLPCLVWSGQCDRKVLGPERSGFEASATLQIGEMTSLSFGFFTCENGMRTVTLQSKSLEKEHYTIAILMPPLHTKGRGPCVLHPGPQGCSRGPRENTEPEASAGLALPWGHAPFLPELDEKIIQRSLGLTYPGTSELRRPPPAPPPRGENKPTPGLDQLTTSPTM
jgi:hypothetical protein